MGISQVTRIPDLDEVEIPEVNRVIRLRDETIFHDILNQNRRVVPTEGPARRGDYVLGQTVPGQGEGRTVHVELGGGHFPVLEAALTSCRAGAVVSADGGAPISVLSICRPVEFPLTDENLQSLGLEGIRTRADYRRDYVERNGQDMAQRAYEALKGKYLDQLAQCTGVALDEGEVADYDRQQKEMIMRATDSDEEGFAQRLNEAYGDHGKRTPEECRELFFAENRRNFILTLLGRAMAERDKREPTAEERAQAMEYYSMIWEKSPEEIEAEGLTERALDMVYLQYVIGAMRQHYCRQVRIVTEEN